MIGFIKRYLLPREVDFNAALEAQARIARHMVETLYQACIKDDRKLMLSIDDLAADAHEQKTRNMKELLNVFITPYDKESIYRMIIQLDWITLSVKHFRLEADVYDLDSLAEYDNILKVTLEMADALLQGISVLKKRNIELIDARLEQIHDQYDDVVAHCARATALQMTRDDPLKVIRTQLMMRQLKDLAMRIHVAANTLEDMALKVS